MLEIRGVSKSFVPGKPVLNTVDFGVPTGEIACLLGPSGCGKTTLLRVIAGLERPDAGSVWLDGEDITNVAVYLRRFGFMFQDYALFPHMTVGANVAYGLRMEGRSKAEREQRVAAMLALVNLPGYAARPVEALSGGEQQRVALARTLAPSPRLLLLDEPLANLDRLLRDELVDELRTILRRVGVTTIFVTHDQSEAFALADRVLVMNAGQIAQDGPPQGVYAQPSNAFVAGFLGFTNLLPGLYDAQHQAAHTALGLLPLGQAPSADLLANPYCVLIKPDAAHVLADGAASAPPGSVRIHGTVQSASFRGSIYRTEIAPAVAPGVTLSFDLPAQELSGLPKPGQALALSIHPSGVLLVADDAGVMMQGVTQVVGSPTPDQAA